MAHFRHNQGTNLYIKFLDENIDDERLFNEFAPYGKLLSVKIMRQKNGKSRGFGFVCFASAQDANKAIKQMHGRVVGSQPIYVVVAQSRKDRQDILKSSSAASDFQGPESVPNRVFYSTVYQPIARPVGNMAGSRLDTWNNFPAVESGVNPSANLNLSNVSQYSLSQEAPGTSDQSTSHIQWSRREISSVNDAGSQVNYAAAANTNLPGTHQYPLPQESVEPRARSSSDIQWNRSETRSINYASTDRDLDYISGSNVNYAPAGTYVNSPEYSEFPNMQVLSQEAAGTGNVSTSDIQWNTRERSGLNYAGPGRDINQVRSSLNYVTVGNEVHTPTDPNLPNVQPFLISQEATDGFSTSNNQWNTRERSGVNYTVPGTNVNHVGRSYLNYARVGNYVNPLPNPNLPNMQPILMPQETAEGFSTSGNQWSRRERSGVNYAAPEREVDQVARGNLNYARVENYVSPLMNPNLPNMPPFLISQEAAAGFSTSDNQWSRRERSGVNYAAPEREVDQVARGNLNYARVRNYVNSLAYQNLSNMQPFLIPQETAEGFSTLDNQWSRRERSGVNYAAPEREVDNVARGYLNYARVRNYVNPLMNPNLPNMQPFLIPQEAAEGFSTSNSQRSRRERSGVNYTVPGRNVSRVARSNLSYATVASFIDPLANPDLPRLQQYLVPEEDAGVRDISTFDHQWSRTERSRENPSENPN